MIDGDRKPTKFEKLLAERKANKESHEISNHGNIFRLYPSPGRTVNPPRGKQLRDE